jgi:hypothetical protein
MGFFYPPLKIQRYMVDSIGTTLVGEDTLIWELHDAADIWRDWQVGETIPAYYSDSATT